MYREVFNVEFNVGFPRPKSNRCDCCKENKMNMEKGFTSLEYKKQFERHIFLRLILIKKGRVIERKMEN